VKSARPVKYKTALLDTFGIYGMVASGEDAPGPCLKRVDRARSKNKQAKTDGVVGEGTTSQSSAKSYNVMPRRRGTAERSRRGGGDG
jgi:hypothetical protein